MIAFIRGVVFNTLNDSVIVDVHDVGYVVFTSQPRTYTIGKSVFFYTYHHIREDANQLYGFTTKEDFDLFLRLIDVKGLGCKSALNMLSGSTANKVIEAIEKGDVTFLKGMPGIGAKTAQQIVLDLKGKLVLKDEESEIVDDLLNDARDALLALGYKANEIKSVLAIVALKEYKSSDEAIRLALTEFMKRK